MEITYHRLKCSTLVWVALAFGIFVIIGWYSARMTNDFPSYDAGRAEQRKATLAKVQHDENAQLYPTDKDGKPTATWADQDKGLIAISIDEAMTHELADLKNVPVGPGAPIPGVAPAAQAAPPPAATPATNAAPAAAAPPTSTNAAPAKPAPPAKPKPKKKKPLQTPDLTPPPAHASATPVNGAVITPVVINQPVIINLHNMKTAGTGTFQGFIQYGSAVPNLPVFKTRRIARTVVVREGQNIVVIGTLISTPPPAAASIPNA